MAQIEILLPKMGESVAEATITKWLIEEGQTVDMDDPIVEIATDKVDSEVPAPEEGVITKILVAEGDVIQVGQPIAIFSTDGDTASAPTPIAAAAAPAPVAAPTAEVIDTLSAPLEVGEISKNGPSGRFYSPLVRTIASKEGISMSQLESVVGSGKEGRVTKKDILAFIESGAVSQAPPTHTPAAAVASNGKTAPAPKPAAAQVAKSSVPVHIGEGDEIVEMDRMRKMISDHMVMSKATSAHVTSFVEADVTNLVLWREKVKKKFEEANGEKLTFTPLFIEAVTKAIKDFPGINVQLDGSNIIFKKDINVGMAAALPSGNLIVPVIHNADQYNLVGLAKKVNDLANRARQNKLKPDDISGGTYTVSNVGTFGNVMGTPIINQPQVAILALGAIRKKPAIIETPAGDTIGIRHMMFLSHSYDHRVVDGMLGGTFVRRVGDYLETFDLNREI